MIWKYVIKDLSDVMQYLPYGIMAGAVMGLILNGMNARRERKGKEAFPMAGLMAFSLYLMIILVITFFSREDGSRIGVEKQGLGSGKWAAVYALWLCLSLGISLAAVLFPECVCSICDQSGSGDDPADHRQRLFAGG